MLKNYIFDFGQVLVHFNPEYMTNVYIKDTADCKLAQSVIFDRLYWDRLDEGTISDREVKEGICYRLPEHLHKSAVEVYDNWYFNIPLIEGMKELVSDIKAKGGKLYLLSNISIGFAENYTDVLQIKELLSLFDGLVFSGKIGITKPDKKIFKYLLDKYCLKAEESIFIDDNINNVKGSKAVGIEGYLFEGDAFKLRQYLKL